MNKSEKLMWMYLLKHGSVYKDYDYYGGFNFSPKKDKEMRKSIREHGINWEETQSVEDTFESSFQGTFAEFSEEAVLEGVLVTGGVTYTVGTRKEDSVSLIEIVLELIDLDVDTKINEQLTQL